MKKLSLSLLGVLALALVLFGTLRSTAATNMEGADILTAAPANARVLLENEHVRVLESWSKPGEKEAMHGHPAYVVYNMSDYKMRFTGPDGKSVDAENKAGEAKYFPALQHSAENIGTTESRAIIVELKGPLHTGME